MNKILITGLLCISAFGVNAGAFNRPDINRTMIIPVEQSPFTFMNGIPEKIKVGSGIDLSFFVNKSIVFQYRYRVLVPKEAAPEFAANIGKWSGWIDNDIVNLKVRNLAHSGSYRIVMEYRTHTGTQVVTYYRNFEVYRENPEKIISNPAKPSTTKSLNEQNGKIVAKAVPPTVVSPAVIAERQEEKDRKAVQPDPVSAIIEPVQKKEVEVFEVQVPQDEMLVKKRVETVVDIPASMPLSKEMTTKETVAEIKDSKETAIIEIPAKNYNKLLLDAIHNKDYDLFKESLDHGVDIRLASENGGNLLHIMIGNIENEKLIKEIISKGIAVDKADDYGNTPLHLSILSGKTDFAKYLLNQGANMNTLNKSGLSPLHLASCLNNKDLVVEMLNKGAKVNLQGNTNYTALQIAAELNNYAIAKELLLFNAKPKIKNEQKLNSIMISKIQGNHDMGKLIKSRGKALYITSQQSLLHVNSNPYPTLDFSLPFDKELVRKRNTFKTIQWIAVPVLAAGLASSTYMKLIADRNYTNYRNAASLEEAQLYYDKTAQYDTYTYISAGISVIPLYALVHSSIIKSRVTKRMKKTF